jgi:hypothetical protein
VKNDEIRKEALAYDRERLAKLEKTGYADTVPQTLAGAIAYVESGRLTARGQAIEMIAKRMAWQGINEAVPKEQLGEGCDEETWWERAYRPDARQRYRERAEEILHLLGSACTVGEL